MWRTLLLRIFKFFVDAARLLTPVLVWLFRACLILVVIIIMLLFSMLIF